MTRSFSEPEAPLYQTDLAQTPLPDLLVKIHRYKAPGRIDCRRGEITKRIYLDHGSIIFGATNQISESLGDRLLNAGRITREQYDESLRLARTTGKRHGVTLVDMNLLSPNELFVAVREQIEEIVWSIFAWDSAAVAFTPGRDKHLEFVKVDIAVPQAVMRGVRLMPDARALLARMGTRTTLLSRTKGRVAGLTLSADEEALLAAANGKTPLPELVNVGTNAPADNARLLYGLFVLGLVAPKERLKVRMKSGRPVGE